MLVLLLVVVELREAIHPQEVEPGRIAQLQLVGKLVPVGGENLVVAAARAVGPPLNVSSQRFNLGATGSLPASAKT